MLTNNDLHQIRGVVLDVVHTETRKIIQEETPKIVREIVKTETRAIVREEIKPIKDDIIFLKSGVSKLERGQEVIVNELVGVINMFGEEFDRTHARLHTIENRLGIVVD